MSWWPFNKANPRPELSAEQLQRLRAWQQLPHPAKQQPLPRQRWVVMDSESSGLDLQRDRLLSLAAVGVEQAAIQVKQSFDCRLQQTEASSDANILIHGIGAQEQRSGQAPADALLNFLHFAGRDILVAFHADFDRTMLDRALAQYLGKQPLQWLDLADLCPALFPELAPGRKTLDDWLAAFDIEGFERHNALSDAWVSAELFLIALAHLPANIRNSSDLQTFAGQARKRRQLNGGW
ncbi:MAG: 3'-5' exonuclease [Chitinivorax sp.]